MTAGQFNAVVAVDPGFLKVDDELSIGCSYSGCRGEGSGKFSFDGFPAKHEVRLGQEW